MQKIADHLGITKVSVSKALSNRPGVSDDLRRRIVETASNMGYVPGQSQAEKKSYAFVVPKRYFLETDKFYNAIFYYMNNLYMKGNSTLVPVIINITREENVEKKGFYDDFDGIFLAGELSELYINMIHSTGKPIVAIDFYKTHLDVPYVLIDNFYIGYQVTNYLIENGHEEIGFVGNISQTSSISDRFFGYLKALQEASVSLCEEWIISNNDAKSGLYDINTELPSIMPTAFVCHCDMAAYFLSNTLKKSGLSVPDNISLISFDNTEISEAYGLTSVDIDKRDIADTAIDVMDRIVQGKKHHNRNYVSTQLIIRNSVKTLV